jgi:hypothetical protein
MTDSDQPIVFRKASYLELAKHLSLKHCLTVGNAHQTLADILQEAIEAERAACKAIADGYGNPPLILRGDWNGGKRAAGVLIAEDIAGRGK